MGLFRFFSSTIGQKYLMAITGLVWSGFILGHMAGNLLLFVGPDAFNAYGHAIVSNKPLLYATELIIGTSLIVHVFLAIRLSLKNKAAREQSYAKAASGAKKVALASRTMAIHGSIILAFIIWHLLTFKYGEPYETVLNGETVRDLHRNVVEAFNDPLYVVGYVVSLVLLGFHLSHGVSSTVQSLGLRKEKTAQKVRMLGYGYAALVSAGFLSQVLYIFIF